MKVLVADDSVLFRRLLADVLATIPGVEIVGTAANGRIALQKVKELSPDLLTLDIEMPELDGVGVIDALLRQGYPKLEVLVVSSTSPRAGDLTMQAMERGAFDFISKPEANDSDQARRTLQSDLVPRLRAIAHRLEVRSILGGKRSQEQPSGPSTGPDASPEQTSVERVAGRMQRIFRPARPEMVLIGVSTGGPKALGELLPALPRDLGVPIVIVQHMPPVFTKSLADSLASKCLVRVVEAVQGEAIVANTAYIAPGGRHLRLDTSADGRPVVNLSDDPPENNCRPAVDCLLRSAANRIPGRSLAVILTGMGNDGTLGLRLLKRHGCYAIAQDEASCVVYGMPKSIVDAGLADVVLPLNAIAPHIVAAVREGRR
ncbi:protein-glutamate methylesterase/protein-glutamine glutaminase [Occallatibacter savannae]|uniref:protein-glutamate methylesterase/protein-glutamine glutaminase n=1 Tax=Occallatibacter savannae TaxID=1002691 RepID=UPI000D69CB4C|nr:chemotaxis response regulator protein-glutamate methylesterase [Occallatibacter savannae]